MSNETIELQRTLEGVRGFSMSSYNRVSYLYSGYDKEAEAIEAKDKMESWFMSSHPDHKDWEITTSVYPTQYGYAVKLEASKSG